MNQPIPSRSVPAPPVKQCPSRVEVDPGDREVSASVVTAWIAHLRSHGWTDKDLDLRWLMRARHGVTR